jgi:hypothetical protein
MKNKIFLVSLFILILVSCARGSKLAPGKPLPLASVTENSVEVSISLGQESNGRIFLAATFSPTEAGYHLYSKNIPRNGINGLGRPTLLELTPESKMQAMGELMVSLPEETQIGLDGLMTYPAGPVTLRMEVGLPAGDDWVEDVISVTYMACSDVSCLPPIVGRLVPIRVPGSGMISPP